MSTPDVHDELEVHDRIFLEKLRLASDVILSLGDDAGMLPDTFQTELYIFRDRVERSLLLRADDIPSLLPWKEPAPGDIPQGGDCS